MADPMQAEAEDSVEIEVEDAEIIEDSEVSTETVVEEETAASTNSDESEIAEYSESVKKRINKLTYKIREAERREAAAIDYAKNVQEKLNTTQANLSQKDKNLYDEKAADKQSAVDRNVEHLELMVAKDYWTTEDMSATNAAITAGKAYTA